MELSSLRGLCIGIAPQRVGVRVAVLKLSVTAPVWRLYLGITDSLSWKYDLNKNFHRILSSEQLSNTSATFVLTNWGKKTHNKLRYQWSLSSYHIKPCKLSLLLYFVLKLLKGDDMRNQIFLDLLAYRWFHRTHAPGLKLTSGLCLLIGLFMPPPTKAVKVWDVFPIHLFICGGPPDHHKQIFQKASTACFKIGCFYIIVCLKETGCLHF